MKIWQALYNHMTYESSAETLSLHKSKEGAEMAIKKHKHRDKLEHLKRFTPDRLKKVYTYKIKAGFTDDEIEEYDQNELEDWPKSWQWWGIRDIEVEE
jgi:hypothetical protein